VYILPHLIICEKAGVKYRLLNREYVCYSYT
jgi:hypothetical protein